MLRSVAEARRRHAAEKPEGILETDSEESLQAVVTGSKETCGRLQEEKGRLEQQIEADDRRAAERQEKEAELESLRAERDELSSKRCVYAGA